MCVKISLLSQALPSLLIFNFIHAFVINIVRGACCAPVAVSVMGIVRSRAEMMETGLEYSKTPYLHIYLWSCILSLMRQARRLVFLQHVSSWVVVGNALVTAVGMILQLGCGLDVGNIGFVVVPLTADRLRLRRIGVAFVQSRRPSKTVN